MILEEEATIVETANPSLVNDDESGRRPWQYLLRWWSRTVRVRRRPRQLRLAESLALGEKRFVAVVEFGQSRYLVGGTSSSLVLLARLDENANAAETAAETVAHTTLVRTKDRR